MCDPISAIAAVASLASSISGFIGDGGGSSVQPQAPAMPPGPPKDLTKFNRPGEIGQAPGFLQLSSGMTPLQQRAAIATYGVSGNESKYRDPAVVNYYRNLVLSDTVENGGKVKAGASYLPIEKEYLAQLGQTPRNESTESFLSALTRA